MFLVRWLALKAPHGSDYVYIESSQVQQGEFPQTAQGLTHPRLFATVFVYDSPQMIL